MLISKQNPIRANAATTIRYYPDRLLAVLTIAALPEGARERMRLAGLTAVGLIVSLSLSWPVNWAAILR